MRGVCRLSLLSLLLLAMVSGRTLADDTSPLQRIQAHLQQDEVEEALQLIEPWVAEEPIPQNTRLYGIALARLNREAEAEPYLERAIARNPTDLTAGLAYIQLKRRQGEAVIALDQTDRLLQHHPDNPDLLAIWAQLLMGVGELELAVAAAEMALGVAEGANRSRLMLELIPNYEAAGAQLYLKQEMQRLLALEEAAFERPLFEGWIAQVESRYSAKQVKDSQHLIGITQEYDDYLVETNPQGERVIASDFRTVVSLGTRARAIAYGVPLEWSASLQLSQHQHQDAFDQGVVSLGASWYRAYQGFRFWLPLDYRQVRLDGEDYSRYLALKPLWRFGLIRKQELDLGLVLAHRSYTDAGEPPENQRSGGANMLHARWLNHLDSGVGRIWVALRYGDHHRNGSNWVHTESNVATGVGYAMGRGWRFNASFDYWQRDYANRYLPGDIVRETRGDQLYLSGGRAISTNWRVAIYGRQIRSRGSLVDETYIRSIIGVNATRKF